MRLGGADQRVMGEDLQRDRVFAGDDAVDQRARIAGAEIDEVLLTETLQIIQGLGVAQASRRLVTNSVAPMDESIGHAILPFHFGLSRSS